MAPLPRCQTEPCEGCEQDGRVHRVGERWRAGPCRVCQCLHDGSARCSPYCPLGSCPQVRRARGRPGGQQGWGEERCVEAKIVGGS